MSMEAVPLAGRIVVHAREALTVLVSSFYGGTPMAQLRQPSHRRRLWQIAPVAFEVALVTRQRTLGEQPALSSRGLAHGSVDTHSGELFGERTMASPSPGHRLPGRFRLMRDHLIGATQGRYLGRMGVDPRAADLLLRRQGLFRRLRHFLGQAHTKVSVYPHDAGEGTRFQSVEEVGVIPIAPVTDDEVKGHGHIPSLIDQPQSKNWLGFEGHVC